MLRLLGHKITSDAGHLRFEAFSPPPPSSPPHSFPALFCVLTSHNSTLRCPLEFIGCENRKRHLNCGVAIKRKDLTLHLETCKYERISCVREGCKGNFLLQEKEEHGNECEHHLCKHSDISLCDFKGTKLKLEGIAFTYPTDAAGTGVEDEVPLNPEIGSTNPDRES
ncbi:hypothetical protein T439DRAFT_348597 [Meredithblackwellia eburnea MCA 4105]